MATCADRFGLAPIAASCHPFADWKDQPHTDKDRYNQLARDLGGGVERMFIFGAHCHVALPAENERIDIMGQMTYFLPHLLALSASSAFWQGRDTGLASDRLTVFDNLPRTRLPPEFASFGEFRRCGVIEGLIDFGRAKGVSMPELVDKLIKLTAQDATALGCVDEVQRLRDIARETGADRQRAVYAGTCAAGGSPGPVLRAGRTTPGCAALLGT